MSFKMFQYKLRRKIYKSYKKIYTSYRVRRLIKSLRPKRTDNNLIRIGGDSDGGYLLPDDLTDIKACFSAGIGDISDFEFHCANLGMEVYMADASVSAPALIHPKFHFQQRFIGNKKNDSRYISIHEWLNANNIGDNEELLLQMDIEGDEFDAINQTHLKTLSRFRILIIEFHELQKLFEDKYFKKANLAFKKILKEYTCVHIHPNNCCGKREIHNIEIPVVAEFTFIRKDRVKVLGKIEKFPNEMDRDNVEGNTLVLPEIWY